MIENTSTNMAMDEIENEDSHVVLKAEHFQCYGLYCGFKRVFDFCLAVVSVIFLLPFFLVICLLIRIESKGSAIFTQKRVGKNGKFFKFYKFRSMYADCNQIIHENHVQQTRHRNKMDFMIVI